MIQVFLELKFDKDNEVLFSVDVTEHSLRYAEDCAENYATGIVEYAN